MANESNFYGYMRAATASQVNPEEKRQMGTICLLQKMGYTVALAPKHFDGDDSKLSILPVLAELEADHPEFQNAVRLLQTDPTIVIKRSAGK